MHFFTFTHVRQTCFAYNFFLCIFSHLLWFFPKKIFLGHIRTYFVKLWSQTRKKRLKESKNLFSKCVLDFNFAPIKGCVLYFLKKSQIRCTLLYMYKVRLLSMCTNLTFFTKIKKNTAPTLAAKLNSKIHLLKRFFNFLSHFVNVWLQSLRYGLIFF